jgi:predicted SprT family Zn-dependent metalloprotease
MKLLDAQRLALRIMGGDNRAQTNFLAAGWKFRWTNRKRSFGLCRITATGEKWIELSAPLVRLNDETEVTKTILHELAHAMAGLKEGHNNRWKLAALSLGIQPERCFSSEDVATPQGRFRYECPKQCGFVASFHRRVNTPRTRSFHLCPKCAKNYRGTPKAVEFKLVPLTVSRQMEMHRQAMKTREGGNNE